MTKTRVGRALLALLIPMAFAVPVFVSVAAHARATPQSQTPSATPSPSVSPTPIQVNAKNTVFGLLVLTGCAAGGYFTAKWIRRRQRPRPPGPWFGGRRQR